MVLEFFDGFFAVIKHFFNTSHKERVMLKRIEHDEYVNECKKLAVLKGKSNAEFVYDEKSM